MQKYFSACYTKAGCDKLMIGLLKLYQLSETVVPYSDQRVSRNMNKMIQIKAILGTQLCEAIFAGWL